MIFDGGKSIIGKSIHSIAVTIIALFMVTELVSCSRDTNSPNTFNMELFENAMNVKGYNYEIKDVEQDFLPTTRKRMIIDDKVIDIYLFSNDNEMEHEASHIDSGGYSYNNSSNVSWVSIPHFYKKGSLIVEYVGEDENIMSDLPDILGEEFAGNTPY